MGAHMKTTIDIADDLLLRAKGRAREQRMTLRGLVEQGLRRVLDEEAVAPPEMAPVTFGGRGLRPEFRNASWETIRDLVYEQ